MTVEDDIIRPRYEHALATTQALREASENQSHSTPEGEEAIQRAHAERGSRGPSRAREPEEELT